jgi:hypothetical protein
MTNNVRNMMKNVVNSADGYAMNSAIGKTLTGELNKLKK